MTKNVANVIDLYSMYKYTVTTYYTPQDTKRYFVQYVMSDYEEPPGVKVYGYTDTRKEAEALVNELMKPSRKWRKESAILNLRHRDACISWIERNLGNLKHYPDCQIVVNPHGTGWASQLRVARDKYGIREPVPEPDVNQRPQPYFEETTPWYGFFIVEASRI